MNISVKNMLVAFVAGLFVFSFVMLILCTDIFGSKIDIAEKDDFSSIKKVDSIILDKTVVFKENNVDDDGYFLLAMIDEHSKKIVLVPIYLDYLIPYKGALSYVYSVYSELGDEMLPEMIRAFSGIPIEKENICCIEDTEKYENFMQYVLYELENTVQLSCNLSEYQIQDFCLVIEEKEIDTNHETVNIVDIEQNIKKFRTMLGEI